MRKGFTLVELLVAVAISGILSAALYTTYARLYSGAKQQSKITESAVDSYIGAEILRTDLVNMGLGIAAEETYTGSSARLYPVNLNGTQDTMNIYTSYDRLDPKTHGWRLLKCNNASVCEFDDEATGIGNDVYTGLKIISTLNGKAINPSFGSVSNADYYYAVGYPYDTSKADKYRTIGYRLSGDCNGDGISDTASRCAAGTTSLCRNGVPVLDCVGGWKLYGGYADSEGITYDTLSNIKSLNGGAALGNIRRLTVYMLVQEGQYDRDFKFGADTLKKDLTFDAINDPLDEAEFAIPAGGQSYRWNIMTVDVRTYNVRR